MTEEELLKDTLINIDNGKYTFKEMISALSYGEKNLELMNKLTKEFAPQYHMANLKPDELHFMSFTFILKYQP
jgi:hypothetical protein